MTNSKLIKSPEEAIETIKANMPTSGYQMLREALDMAIETLKRECWIPVEERLPEEHTTMFAKLKGTPKWRESMFEKMSGTVNVTVMDCKGDVCVTHAHTVDGKWLCDLLRWRKGDRIIAWIPLPEPYRQEEAGRPETRSWEDHYRKRFERIE